MKPKQSICLSPSSLTAFLFLVTFLNTTIVSASYNGNETDRLALLSFKSMITHDPYGALSSWNSSLHFCGWSGVSCGKRHKRVTAIRLQSKGLVGSLSPHVGNLSFLRAFWLLNNSFEGDIPHELGRLFRVKELVLGHNRFKGAFPANLSHCSNLELLVVGDNNLVGSIPNEISSLTKLEHLEVNSNSFTGGIPPFLGNITSMKAFYAHENPLGGSIPHTLGHWKSLKVLSLHGCNLHGTIAHSIYNLSHLIVISISENQLTGSLPPSFGAILPHLEVIQLWDNQLIGPLPSSISNCSNLESLQINGNNFSGKLKIDFSRLRNIYSVILANNSFGSGEADEMEFLDSLTNCSKLHVFQLYMNKLQGVLPNSIGNFSKHLIHINFGGNQLYGSLPSSVGNLVGLTSLFLQANQFTGEIPSTIGKLQNLESLGLYENQFWGRIPDSIGNLSLLTKLSLYSNKLEGHIPSTIGNLHRLLFLFLDNNKLTGIIPKQLLQLSSPLVSLNLSQNSLFGSLPAEVGQLKSLNELDLSGNNLSGYLPISLGECISLEYLNLKDNLFDGMLPQSLSSLRGVEFFDFSHNNFSGQIPQFFERFSLRYLNLSFNDFEGEVPVKGVFANASAFSIFGNSRLCGGLLELGLPKCEMKRKHKKWTPLLVAIICIACSLLGILCFVYFWRKKKNKGHESQSLMKERFLKISYNQLFKATDGFSEANLIGKGGFSSVYKGILDHNNKIVAIKVLHLQTRGAHKSFISECEAWRSIRHRNLLKIITACSSVDFQGNDFKSLVYEFMPNGSLEDWLHSSANTSRLNLLQRINILIDVASALDYIHNRCQMTIVHCDLKPSNILLDDDMVAHVGDFGLARFLQTDSGQNSSTGIRGTVGYAAPEYGLGSEMTRSGDVYSFGILSLELMTRKKPTDDIFKEGLNLHKLAYMALPDHVTDVVDADLLNFVQEDATATRNMVASTKKVMECLASIVKIGVACSMDSPPDRMSIENVLYELQHIRDVFQNTGISEIV